MKIEKPMSQREKNSQSKFSSIQKFLLFLSLIFIAFTVFKPVVILFLGLLPTLTVVVVDTKNINKITTIGCFNVAGLMICLKNLFEQMDQNIAFSIVDNIYNVVIMLAAAALGVLLYYVLPDLFVFIFKNSAQHRLKAINAKLEKLQQNWANIIPEDR